MVNDGLRRGNFRTLSCLGGLALIAVIGLPVTSDGAPITYTINLTITNDSGTNPGAVVGSVTGTVTTDGNTGNLGIGDVTSWSLDLNDGILVTQHIDQTNSTFNTNGDLSATATQLSFNFSGSGDALFEHTGGLPIYWGLQGVTGGLIGACPSCETVRTNSAAGL